MKMASKQEYCAWTFPTSINPNVDFNEGVNIKPLPQLLMEYNPFAKLSILSTISGSLQIYIRPIQVSFTMLHRCETAFHHCKQIPSDPYCDPLNYAVLMLTYIDLYAIHNSMPKLHTVTEFCALQSIN